MVTEPSPQPLRFVVFGRPQQKGSKRALPIRGRAPAGHHIVLVDANRNAAPWAGRVAAEAIRAYGPQRELQRTPVAVFMRFYFSRPRGHFGMGRNASRVKASAPDHMGVMPDIDKLARCALDALTGTVLKDDALVSELSLAKRWGEPERLEVEVLAL